MDAGKTTREGGSAGAVVVAVLLPLLTLDRLDPSFSLLGGSARVEELAVWIALAWMAWRGSSSEASGRVLAWATPFLALVALSHLVSLPIHQAPAYWLRYTVFIWAIWATVRCLHERELGPVRAGILVAALVSTAATVADIGLGADRARGLFLTATALAGHLGLLAPFTLAHALRRPSREAYLWWGTTALLVLSALLTLSRAGVAAMGVGLVMVLAANWGTSAARRRLVLVVATMFFALVAVTVFVAMFALQPVQLDAPQSEDDARRVGITVAVEHLANLRIPIWRVGWAIAADHPWLGIGGPTRYAETSGRYAALHETLSPELPSYPDEVEREVWRKHAHQAPLQIAAQWGWPAVLAALAFLGFLARRLWTGAAHDVWALGALGALAGFVTHNLLGYTVGYLAGEAGLLLGLGAGWSATAESDDFDHAGEQDSQVE